MNILAWVLQIMLAVCYLPYSVVLLIPPAHMKRLFSEMPFGLRAVMAVVALVAALGLVLPAVMKNLRRFVLPASIVLMILAGGEALFMLARHTMTPAKVRVLFFVMALALVILRWRVTPFEEIL